MVFHVTGCASPPRPGTLEAPAEPPAAFREPLPGGAGTAGSDGTTLAGQASGGVDAADRSALVASDLAWFAGDDSDLAALLAEAVQHNWDLEAAAARVEAADAQATIAGAGRYPSLDASLTRTRSKQNFIGLPIGDGTGVITNMSTSYSGTLTSAWEVDLWGRVRHGAVAANASREAAYADYAGARLSIAGQVAKSWYGVTEARLQAELAERTVASYEASTSQVRARFEEGTRTSLDLRLASSQLASARALLEQRQAALGTQVRQLEILVGRYPDRALEGADTLRTPAAAVPSVVPADLLLRRPDLVAAERRWVAADHRASQARRDLLPKISLTASGGRSSRELSDLLDGDFTVWSFVTNLFQPLFQGGRLRANVKLNDSLGDQAAAAFANATLRAFAEVETLLEASYRLERQEEHLSEAVVQATAARELTESRYRSGLVDYINVLDAQRSELDARSRLLGVQADRLRNRVDLYIALGGGFESPTEILTLPDQSLSLPNQIPSSSDRSESRS
ncbi:MAG: efflux transporter outer membrane subunit [Candidatus Eisenbacteria bacterium]